MDANDLNLLKKPLVKKTEPISIPLIRRSKEESIAFIEGFSSGIAMMSELGEGTSKAAIEIITRWHKEQFGEETE